MGSSIKGATRKMVRNYYTLKQKSGPEIMCRSYSNPSCCVKYKEKLNAMRAIQQCNILLMEIVGFAFWKF